MGTIKKYNRGKSKWESFASSQADQILTSSEKLREIVKSEGEETAEVTDVENVLEHITDDIKTLKGNVAWLALHGGGGSGNGGNGGGTGVDTSTAKIMVNSKSQEQASSDPIILNSDEGLSIKVISGTKNWDIEATSNIYTLKRVSGTNGMNIDRSILKNNNIVTTFPLLVTANNPSTFTTISWSSTIYFSNVNLSAKKEQKITIEDLKKGNRDSEMSFEYSSGVAGDYRLEIDVVRASGTKDKYSFDVIVDEIDHKYTYNVQLGKGGLGFSDNDITLGNNTNEIKARLVSKKVSTLSSLQTRTILVVTSNNMTISSILPTRLEDAVLINKDKSLNVPFTVYYSNTSESYHYSIKVSGNGGSVSKTPSEVFSFNELNNDNFLSVSSFSEGTKLEIRVEIWTDIHTEHIGATYYAEVGRPNFTQLDTPKTGALITDIIAFGKSRDNSSITSTCNGYVYNGTKVSVEQSAEFIDSNSYSGVVISDTKPSHIRLQNRAYCKVGGWNYSNFTDGKFYDFIKSGNEFTINLCYKADYHPDDDRAVFQLGKVAQDGTLLSGILLRVHDLEIKSGGTSSSSHTINLQDDEIVDLVISYKKGRVLIYVNGVIESAAVISDFVGDWAKENILLGSSKKGSVYSSFADINVYRLMMYTTALTDYDILFNYLNNMSLSHYVIDADGKGTPDNRYIEEGLARNFIKYNLDTNKPGESWLWDNSGVGSYNVSNFIAAGSLKPAGELSNYSIPIPIVFLDVSSENSWTWDNFTSPKRKDSNSLPSVSAKIQYYDGKSGIMCGGDRDKPMTATVSIQGTSTLADNIKNLNIQFDEGTVFIPKESWLPEQKYTLKADIVDSSHSINAAVGKFVNEELGYDDVTKASKYLPFNENVLRAFNDSWYKNQFKKATLKHAVEGFPVFVILRTNDKNTGTSIHSLGIYQFILGRDAHRNLGYKVINSITKTSSGSTYSIDKSVVGSTFPFFETGCTYNETRIGGYWIEAKDNFGFGGTRSDGTNAVEGGAQLDYIDGSEQYLRDKLYGALFWQNDPNFNDINMELNIKEPYEGQPEDQVATKPSEVQRFNKLAEEIIKLDAVKKRYSNDAANINKDFFADSYDKYEYIQAVVPGSTSKSYVWRKVEGQENRFAQNDDDIDITNYLNLDSAYKYFSIANLFGLLDNFQKNMPLKFFGKYNEVNKSDPNNQAILGIYDCDTGLGGNNQAAIAVSEDLWFSPLSNSGNGYGVTDKIDGQNSVVLGFANKLWMSLFGKKAIHQAPGAGQSYTKSIYSDAWCKLRNLLDTKMKTVINPNTRKPYTSLADYFIDQYFIPQTEGCGELLFNLTYNAKYLQDYRNESGTPINQLNKLNGRRIIQARKWLRKHIVFLDSVFEWLKMENSTNAETTNLASDFYGISTVKINSSNAVKSMPIKVEAPVIMSSNVAGSKTISSFCRPEKYGDSFVYFGDGTSGTDNAKVHTLDFSNTILSIGNGSTSLTTANVGGITGSLMKYTNLNLSGAQGFNQDNPINLGKLFADNVDVAELREINLSNTNFLSTLATKNFNLNFNILDSNSNTTNETKFQKLQKIDISNSCVTSVSLPNVSLSSLKVMRSRINNLTLNTQNFLNTIDLTGCRDLTVVSIKNCSNFETLKLDSTQSSLRSVDIVNCPKFTRFECVDNSRVREITLSLENLETVTITGCRNLRVLNLAGSKKIKNLDLHDCINLEYIIFSGRPDEASYSTENLELPEKEAPNWGDYDDSGFPGAKYDDPSEDGPGVAGLYLDKNSFVFDADSSSNYHDSILKSPVNMLPSDYDTINIWGAHKDDKFPDLVNLNLRNTGVRFVVYGTSFNKNYLDLSRFTNPNLEVDLRQMKNLSEVKFANDEENPVKLSLNFDGCLNLSRVYGHVVVKTGQMFNSCKRFTVHGYDSSKNTYGTVSESNRTKLPYEVDRSNLTKLSDPDFSNYSLRFQEETAQTPLVTNMDFNASDISDSFRSTAITTFDVYYVLTALGYSGRPRRLGVGEQVVNITKIDNLFSDCSRNDLFSWVNPPNRYMFSWARNVVSARFTFSFSGTEGIPFKLLSPYVVNGEILKDNGLFSPLTDLKNMEGMWANTPIVVDRYLFRRKTGNYKIQNINHFFPDVILNKLDETTEAAIVNKGVVETIKDQKNKFPSKSVVDIANELYGNLTDFFKNLPNVYSSSYLDSTGSTVYAGSGCIFHSGNSYINFDTLRIPEGLTYLVSSFNCAYGSGTINPRTLFASPSSVTGIKKSFIVGNSLDVAGDEVKVKLPISQDTFSGFSNLVSLGYNTTQEYYIPSNGKLFFIDYKGKEIIGSYLTSFCGAGYNKYIVGDKFPYGIVSGCPNLKMFAGFFSDVEAPNFLDDYIPELPGKNMFTGNKLLENVVGLFYNAKFKYKLKGECFEQNTNLKDVSYLFGANPDRVNYLTQTSVPNKLLYHGKTVVSKNLRGLSSDAGISSSYMDDSSTKYRIALYGDLPRSLTGKFVDSNAISIGSKKWINVASQFSNQPRKSESNSINLEISRNGEAFQGIRDIQETKFYVFDTATKSLKDVTSNYTDVDSRSIRVYIELPTGEDVSGDELITDLKVWQSNVVFAVRSLSGEFSFYRSSELSEGSKVDPVRDGYVKEVSISYDLVNKNIEHADYLFRHANLEAYESPTVRENNQDYMPFSWYFDNDNNLVPITRNNKKYTEIWTFDGDWSKSEAKSRGTAGVENLDDNNTQTPGLLYSYTLATGVKQKFGNENGPEVSGTVNYCCSPDLLRYCNPNCSVSYLFADCGRQENNDKYDGGDSVATYSRYGLRGRIPPYLLKPLEKGTSVNLSGMFRNCKLLSYYTVEGGTSYVVPLNLFKYCPNISSLHETFSGIVLPLGGTIDNIFDKINNSTLSDVSYVFYRPVFHGSTESKFQVSNIFTKFTNLSNIGSAFRACKEFTGDRGTELPFQYVSYSNIFNSKYRDVSVGDGEEFNYVFAGYGYGLSNNEHYYVSHENPHTLPDAQNYLLRDVR